MTEYTDEELRVLDEIIDDLVIHMFSSPNNRHPIFIQLERAFELGTMHKEAKKKK